MTTAQVSPRAKRTDPVVIILIAAGILVVAGIALAVWAWLPRGPAVFAAAEPRVEFVVRVNTDDAVRARTEAAAEGLREAITRAGIADALFSFEGPDRFTIAGVAALHDAAFRRAAGAVDPAFAAGTSASGTTAFIMKPASATAVRDQAVVEVERAIGRRLRELAVAKWNVAMQAGGAAGHLLVQVAARPNLDTSRMKAVLGSGGVLQLKLVELGPAPSREELLQRAGGSLAPLTQVVPAVETTGTGAPATVYYVLRAVAVVTGGDIASARPSMDESGRPAVAFSLNKPGAARLRKATGENIGRQLAIVIDGQVVSAPRIDGAIGEDGIITGSFTQTEANDLALFLRSGSLPVSVSIVAEHHIDGPPRR
jgi:preprotein translocase subunit SecD